MEDNYLYSNYNDSGIFYILLQYGKEKTFKEIYEFICKNWMLEIPEYFKEINDYKYFLYWLRFAHKEDLVEDLYDMNTILINFFKIVVYIEKFFTYFDLYNTSSLQQLSKKTEELIEIIIENKQFLWWTKYSIGESNLCFVELKHLKETDFDVTSDYETCTIRELKYHIVLEYNRLKLKLERVRHINESISVNRIKTMYKAFSNTVALFNKPYCPWCNPSIELPHSPKQRRSDICIDIGNYILKYSNRYTAKQLNNIITSIKTDDIEKTIRLRGKKLLAIINEIGENQPGILNIVKNSAYNYTEIEEAIEEQYNLY